MTGKSSPSLQCWDWNRAALVAKTFHNTDFYHASEIEGMGPNSGYVAAQGPVGETLPASRPDLWADSERFWRLVFDTDTGSIMMLCDAAEVGAYLPDRPDSSFTFGTIEVKMLKKSLYHFDRQSTVAQRKILVGPSLPLTRKGHGKGGRVFS